MNANNFFMEANDHFTFFASKFSVNFIHQKLMEEEGRSGKVFETRNSLMARAHLFMQGSGGQFQQRVYKQLLRAQIPKVHKTA